MTAAADLIRHHTTCRVCQSPLDLVLSLGDVYLSDFPNSASTKAHPPVPLHLARCVHPACGLVQLMHTTPAEWMFRTYWYRSGVNETMRAELKDVVEGTRPFIDLPPRSIVVDIGANDGTLLSQYAQVFPNLSLTKVAYEPARNLYEVLRPHAQVLYPEFFSVSEPWPLTSKARIVTSIAMFYDLEDPHRFVADIAKVLHPEGVWVIQQAYLPAMLAQNGLDNICHEHLEYYSLSSLLPLLRSHGLEVVDVVLRDINGGSFRTYVQFAGVAEAISPRVDQMLIEEHALFGDNQGVALDQFARNVGLIRTQLRAVLAAHAAAGTKVDLYGASTKANTLLQYCGIDRTWIRQAWERSPEKWGRYVGTSEIPIVSEEVGRVNPPAALLVGIWAFRDALVQREAGYLQQGGQLIFPLPQVEILQGGHAV